MLFLGEIKVFPWFGLLLEDFVISEAFSVKSLIFCYRLLDVLLYSKFGRYSCCF